MIDLGLQKLRLVTNVGFSLDPLLVKTRLNWILSALKCCCNPIHVVSIKPILSPTSLKELPFFGIQVWWMTDVGPDLSPTSYISTHFKVSTPKLCKWLRLGLGPFEPRTKMTDPRITRSPSSAWLKPAQCWNPIWFQLLFIIMNCNGPPIKW